MTPAEKAALPAELHLEMLRRFPELGSEFGLSEVLSFLGGWVREIRTQDGEAVDRAYDALEKIVNLGSESLTRSALESMVQQADFDVGRHLGPATQAALERAPWWPGCSTERAD